MSATANHQTSAASFQEPKPACQILILHEDFPGYSLAVEVCRRIMDQFASELDFDIKCWNLIELGEADCARHAAKTAGLADIILLSIQTPVLPPVFNRWLEDFFADRSKPDGMLALVLAEPDSSRAGRESLLARLEQVAARLGMDFMPLVGGDAAAGMEILPTEDWPASAAPLEISDHPHVRWGLNE